MNFSLERVFVVPVANALPSAGNSSTLSPNQFGVFLPNLTPATATTAAAAEYLMAVQQRNDNSLNLPTIKSDKIYANKVINKYKVVSTAGQVKIATLTDFDVKCDETISVSLRVYEDDVLMSFANGYTKTYTKKAPCCDCDGDPCASIDPVALEALITEIKDEINADMVLSTRLVASVTGTGAAVTLVLTGADQTEQASADMTVNHYRANAVNFMAWAYKGAPTTQDAIDFDGCDAIGTYTVTQELTYPKGTSDQVKLSEYKHFSYTVPNFKERFSDVNYNGIYHSNVVDGTSYNTFVIQFHNPESVNTWSQAINQDSTLVIYVPVALSAGVEAILAAKYGAFTSI